MRKQGAATGMASSFDHLATPDGALLRCGVWPSERPVRRGSMLLLSGRNEFLEKYGETIGELNARGWDVYSFDWRGQGLSTRLLPDRHKGHVGDYEEYIGDLDRFLRAVVLPRAVRPVAGLAHSMGAHILLRYLSRRGDLLSRAVLTAPMVDIFTDVLPVPVVRVLTRIAVLLGGERAYAPRQGIYLPPGGRRFEKNQRTSDPERYARFHRLIAQNPDLALGGVTFGWLRATFASIDALASPAAAASIRTPLLIVSSGDDRVVPVSAQQTLCAALPDCRFVSVPGARHEILMERDGFRAAFWRAFDGFMAADSRSVAPGCGHSESRSERASQRA